MDLPGFQVLVSSLYRSTHHITDRHRVVALVRVCQVVRVDVAKDPICVSF